MHLVSDSPPDVNEHDDERGRQEFHRQDPEHVRDPMSSAAVVHDPVVPAQHAMATPLSHTPSQSSSRPLHVSGSGTQFVSHAPSPSRSDHPSSHVTTHRPSSHAGEARSPAEQA